MKKLTLLFCLSLVIGEALSQQLELEKTYKISRASKRGELSGLDYDKDAKTYTLTYLTGQKKQGDKVVFKYEQYVFDNDFNFVKDTELEEEADIMKKKFKWFKFKGDVYTKTGNTVSQQFMGGMVLKRKQVTYTYRWLLGGYTRKTELLEKVKPRTEDGKSYMLVEYAEDDINGDLYILTTINAKMGKGMDGVGDFTLLKFNSELEQVAKLDFNFPYKQSLAFMEIIDKPNPEDYEEFGIDGFNFVFAPSDVYGKKLTDPNNNNYTYVKVDANCVENEKFSFESPASYWRIDQMITGNNGEKYFYGPAQAGKDKYFNKAVAAAAPKTGGGGLIGKFGSGETKFKAVQLMKVANGKMAYLTETSLDEFKAKQSFPPSQRKTPDYEGREFGVRSYNFASNGDLIILGQNYDRNKEKGTINKFEDVLGFHFGSDGKLRAQYGLDTKEDGKIVTQSTDVHYGISTTTRITTTITRNFACPQQLIEGKDGKMYWLLREIRDIREGKLLTYPRIGSIDLKTAKVTNLTTFGRGEGFYLNPNYPTLETDKGESIVFFGADRPGKELWFARVKLK